jgi:predicted transcriptional regulator of viral defense system
MTKMPKISKARENDVHLLEYLRRMSNPSRSKPAKYLFKSFVKQKK